jgi:hypothetical protein
MEASLSAYLTVVDSIMAPHEARVSRVPVGSMIADLYPKSAKYPYVCRFNGNWCLRKDWGTQVEAGHTVEFYCYPQGGGEGGSDATRIVLTIAAIYIAVQFGQPWLVEQGLSAGLATAVATTAASALVNFLVPARTGAGVVDSEGTSANYNTSLAGNQAKLDQPIPVLYGRNKTFPDFAAEPYNRYDSNDDQYYHALLCVGQGNYVLEAQLLDDTPLTNFGDVTFNVLTPGTLPTLVSSNIVTAPEVAGNVMTEARIVGPFIACRPKSVAASIQIDISFSRGLATYNATTGAPEDASVSWRVEWRIVDDFGSPLTVWDAFPEETLTLAQTKPVRRTYDYTLPIVGRPQVRLVRTTPFDSNSRVANTMEWAGLRSVLQTSATLCPTATYIEVKMRASEQLTGLTQRKLAVITRRLVRTWNPSTFWSAEVETRNPAWALADKWTNTVYGDSYEDEHIDLDALYRYSLVWDARQDRFDGVFDQTFESFTADQMIAQAGRSAVFRRQGSVMTLTRDEAKDLPVTAFTARNIDPGSTSITFAFANEKTPDGVIVEYFDNRIWDWVPIVCPCPGVVTPTKPQRLRLFGVTGAKHAEREGLYHAYNNFYRRKFPTFRTELEGLLVTFGSLVAFAPSLSGWGRAGDVVDYDSGTLEVTLSEPPRWISGATHYLSFVNRDGTLSNPALLVLPGSTQYKAVLASAPPTEPTFDLASEERTKYVFGAGVIYEQLVRVLSVQNSIADDGRRSYAVSTVIENDLVHTADLALLPLGGVVQDPVDGTPGTDGGGGGLLRIPYLIDDINSVRVATGTVSYTFQNDGRVFKEWPGGSSYLPSQWLLAGPWLSTDAAFFDIRASITFGAVDSGTTGSWLNLAISRQWTVVVVGGEGSQEAHLFIEIRDAATLVVQDQATYKLAIDVPPEV